MHDRLHHGEAVVRPAPDGLRSRSARTVAELAERCGNSRAPGGD
ncbi:MULTISPECIES: hypothetical protein [Streptomyces]|nr:hypothetical protein [Streptomyces sp. CGMCC 4.1456]WNF66183.1 hypothetical protein RJD14_27935 [Streptomyces sp. CGMCC 4.1456]